MQPEVRMQALWEQLETLATFSDAPAPAVTRVLYTEADRDARAYVRRLIEEVGLTLREDALGNLFARWQGSEPTLPAVATGSHIDAIPFSGRYDGTVGVLGALEAIRALKAARFVPSRSIELILFTSEEPTRFGVGCLGSRALAGLLTPEALAALTDSEGLSVLEGAQRAGFSGDVAEVALPPEAYHAFIELHIEQGPSLEASDIPIGIVTAIAAPATLHLTIRGSGGHAGAVLMSERRDALAAAAEMVGLVEQLARDTGASDSVATVGVLDVFPRAVNSIPSRVFMTVDVRDVDLERRDGMVRDVLAHLEALARRRGVTTEHVVVNADPPAACSADVIDALQAAAEAAGLPSRRLVSRAYHDTLFMARLCPVGMLFIPCKAGISHHPDEYARPLDIAQGVSVLAHALMRLAA